MAILGSCLPLYRRAGSTFELLGGTTLLGEPTLGRLCVDVKIYIVFIMSKLTCISIELARYR